jgi:hypothetical protein
MKKELIELRINGRLHELAIEAQRSFARRAAARTPAHQVEAWLR